MQAIRSPPKAADISLAGVTVTGYTAAMPNIVQAPVRAIQIRGEYLDQLSVAPNDPAAGLVRVTDGRLIFMGKLVPPPDRFHEISMFDMSLYHRELYERHIEKYIVDPLWAVSVYIAQLRYEIDSHKYDLMESGNLQDELVLWRSSYDVLIRDVSNWVSRPMDLEHEHVFWTRPDPGYTGRPRASIPGHRRVPIFKLLWPLWVDHTSLPLGRPRKTRDCGDQFSNVAEKNYRLCVNPYHFEKAQEYETTKSGYTRRGIGGYLTQQRYRLVDIVHPRYVAEIDEYFGKCPRGHAIDDEGPNSPVRRWVGNGEGSGMFICQHCQYEAGLYVEKFGREHPATRARHDPTPDELAEDRALGFELNPGRSHKAEHDETAEDLDDLDYLNSLLSHKPGE